MTLNNSKPSQPAISVVIPTYNRAQVLSRCLDSLVAQDFTNFEVIVCDDGSTDHTAQVISQYSSQLNLVYDIAPNSGGPARPRNRGLALSRSSYVAFLDSDDWWTPTKLRLSFEELERGFDIVYHDLYIVRRLDQRLYFRKIRSRDLVSPVFNDLLRSGNALNNSSVVLRKELLLKVGGISEAPDLVGTEDYDAWLRIASLTNKFSRLPQTLGFYWAGGNNISNDDRYINLLQALKSRYFDCEAFCFSPSLPFWVSYAEGCYHLRHNRYRLALKHLTHVCSLRPRNFLLIKSILIIIYLYLYLTLSSLFLRSS